MVYTLTTLVANAARDSDVVHGSLHSHPLKSPKLPGFLKFHVVHTLTPKSPALQWILTFPGVYILTLKQPAPPGILTLFLTVHTLSLSLLESPILPAILTLLVVHTLTSHVASTAKYSNVVPGSSHSLLLFPTLPDILTLFLVVYILTLK